MKMWFIQTSTLPKLCQLFIFFWQTLRALLILDENDKLNTLHVLYQWQCGGVRGLQTMQIPFWAECVPQKSCCGLFSEQLLCVVGVVWGSPKVGSVHHGPVRETALGFILAISCLTAATIFLWDKWKDLFCQYQTLPSFVEKAYWLILIMDLYSLMNMSYMSYPFYLKEQLLLHLPLSLVKMKELKVIVRFIPCAS